MRIKTETKRREILDAAAIEFSRRGFHETTLGHVAARMGSSKATLYNYFPSKTALFAAMLAAAAHPATAALLETLDRDAPLAERLAAFARAFVRMQAGEHAVAIQRLVIAESAKMGSALGAFRDDPAIQPWPRVAEILRTEQSRGSLRAGDCAEMARHLCALLQGDLPMRLLFGEPPTFTDAQRDASADSAVRMFLAAYGA